MPDVKPDIELFAPAKINLFLEIVNRRPDGYHELQSIMLALDLGDTLGLTFADSVCMTCNDPGLPLDEGNLVIRAARLFEQTTGQTVRVRFDLTKRIPTAAGLGGGSSDAAAALRGLNRLYETGLDAPTLEQMAGRLGADVPFFIRPGHKIARGIGQRLSPLVLEPELDLLLINPGHPVSTAETYEKFQLTRMGNAFNLPSSLRGLKEVLRLLRNDLEAVVIRDFPAVARMKTFLVEAGCAACMMSGSGPTVFGIFEDALPLDRIAAKAELLGWKAWVTRTCAHGS